MIRPITAGVTSTVGMKANDAKRLKELERENATLKRIVADQVLENQALKEISRGRMKGQVLPGVIAVAARAWRCPGVPQKMGTRGRF